MPHSQSGLRETSSSAAVDVLMEQMQIVVLNDTKRLNGVYRGPLMKAISGMPECQVESMGLPDFLLTVIKGQLKDRLLISSNIRANIVHATLFRNRRGIVILNGFGALADSGPFISLLRSCFLRGLRNKLVIVQNPTDLRFLRRQSVDARLVYGSGGLNYARQAGGLVLVTRPGKIERQKASLLTLPRSFGECQCYGVDALPGELSDGFKAMGFQGDKNLLYGPAATLVVPYGYREGFPHSLAESICSGSSVLIDKRMFAFLGLSRAEGLVKTEASPGWYYLPSQSLGSLPDLTSAATVEKMYSAILSEMRDQRPHSDAASIAGKS